jgi:hypothetical protein
MSLAVNAAARAFVACFLDLFRHHIIVLLLLGSHDPFAANPEKGNGR